MLWRKAAFYLFDRLAQDGRLRRAVHATRTLTA